jgi:AhpD family alkylhydroperoxidase
MASETQQQFKAFETAAFAEGALSAKTKELIAFAVAITAQSQHCIEGHLARAANLGATDQELIEAMWVAVNMRAATGMQGDGEGAERVIRRMVSANRLSGAVGCR